MASNLPKLLRAIANGMRAQEEKHDVIFNAAADEIERLERAILSARMMRLAERQLEQ